MSLGAGPAVSVAPPSGAAGHQQVAGDGPFLFRSTVSWRPSRRAALLFRVLQGTPLVAGHSLLVTGPCPSHRGGQTLGCVGGRNWRLSAVWSLALFSLLKIMEDSKNTCLFRLYLSMSAVVETKTEGF